MQENILLKINLKIKERRKELGITVQEYDLDNRIHIRTAIGGKGMTARCRLCRTKHSEDFVIIYC